MKLADLAGEPGYPAFNTLAGTLPQLQAAEAKLHQLALQRGIDYRIAQYGGLRTQKITDLLMQFRRDDYAAAIKTNPAIAKIPIEKWRPVAPYDLSRHKFGSAFDVVLTKLPKGMSSTQGMETLGALAEKYCNLRWGGHFPEDRIDVKHFELTPPMATLEVAWNNFLRGARTLTAGAVASTASGAERAEQQVVKAVQSVPQTVEKHKAMTTLILMLLTGVLALKALKVV
jgi:hypothetical protein